MKNLWRSHRHKPVWEEFMRRWLLLTAAVVVGAPVAPALAQNSVVTAKPKDTSDVSEVVVVARRREERLRDIPVAASVVDAQLISARGGVTDPEKLLQGIPGVRYVNTVSPTTAETSVRASGTSRGTFAESAIGLYRDGVYVGGGLLGGRNFTRADLFDIDRAEVLRGTQSALYGRNAVGGAINIITKKPQFEKSGFLDARYGFNNQQYQVQGVYNTDVNERVSIRVGAQVFDQSSGFFYNKSRNEYFDIEKGHIARAQVKFQDENFSVNALYENQVSNLPALNWQLVIPAGGSWPRGYTSEKSQYNWNSPSLAKQQVNSFIVTSEASLGNVSLVSTSAYRNRLTKNAFDQDSIDKVTYDSLRASGTLTGVIDYNTAQRSQDDVTTYYQDIHATGNYSESLKWLIGGEILQVRNDYQQDNARTPTTAIPSRGTSSPAEQEINSYAAYGTIDYRISNAFGVSAEIRYANDVKDFYSERFDLTTGLSAGSRFRIKGSRDSQNVTYNLTGSYRNGGWLAYAKVGTAYRTGGFNRDLGDPRAPRPVTPSFGDESALTYEVGAKGNLVGNVYFEGAAYRTETDDLLVQLDNGCSLVTPSCPVAATPFMVNAGEGRSWGVEGFVNVLAQVGDGRARLSLGVSRQGGEVTSGPFKGASFPQVPDWVASATLNHRVPVRDGIDLVTNLAYRAQWGGVQEIAGTPRLWDYQQLDARLALDFGHWEIAAFANNATNSTYVNFGSATVRRWSQPRLYGVQMRYQWR